MPKTPSLAAAGSTAQRTPKAAVPRPAAPRARQAAVPPGVPAAPRTPTAATARRRARQIEDKRSAILGAALGLFSRFGLHGTSVAK